MILKIFNFISLALMLKNVNGGGGGFEEVFKWKQISFHQPASGNGGSMELNGPRPDIFFPGPDNSNVMKRPSRQPVSGGSFDYIAYNNVPMGVSRYKEKLFITLPRRRNGIPATLSYINLNNIQLQDISPKLTAFPNHDINSLHPQLQRDPERIVSVYRTRPDYTCGRLWFIDTGVLEYPNNTQQIQQPSIWILDLENNNRVVRRFEFPASTVTAGMGLASITIDVNKNCDDSYAYVPDLLNYRLYVYSLRSNTMWTFSHNYFGFDPISGDFNIGGQQFQWNDGIFSITLGNQNRDGFRNAYFHPMASNSEFMVSTKVLRNQTNAGRSWHGNDFIYLGQRGPNTQSTMHDFDKNTGIIFYAEIANYGVGCWNTNKEFCSCNHETLQTSLTDMIYPSDLTIDNEGYVWMMSNSMPVFIYSNLDPNIYNFRVWRQNVKKAVKGTDCE